MMGNYSEIVLKATSWLERLGQFKFNVLYVNTKDDGEEEKCKNNRHTETKGIS